MAMNEDLNPDVKALKINLSQVYTEQAIIEAIRSRGCAELGRECGIARQELHRIPTGKRKLTPRILDKLGIECLTLYRDKPMN